jgi:hypothetical protein
MFKKNFILLFFLALISIGFAPIAHAGALPQHSHAHDCSTANQISLGSDVVATLVATDDYAVYRIALNERGLLDVSIDPGAMDAWDMELLDSSCQPVPEIIGDVSLLKGNWAEITVPHKDLLFPTTNSVWTLGSGVYFVRIRPNPVDVFQDQFTFHTTFIPHYGHDCATAEAIKLSNSIEGELLYAEDREVFRLTTTDTGQIHGWTTGPLTPKQPVIELYFQDCSSGIEQQTSDDRGIITTSLAPGTYYLSVEPQKPDQLGRFTLHIEFIQERTSAAATIPR